MRFSYALACAVAMLVPACTPAGNVPTNTAPVETSVLTPACDYSDAAMYALEAAYNVPAHAYVTADAAGKLPAEVKAKAKPVLVETYAFIANARIAHSMKDAVGFCDAKSKVDANVSTLNRLIPK